MVRGISRWGGFGDHGESNDDAPKEERQGEWTAQGGGGEREERHDWLHQGVQEGAVAAHAASM